MKIRKNLFKMSSKPLQSLCIVQISFSREIGKLLDSRHMNVSPVADIVLNDFRLAFRRFLNRRIGFLNLLSAHHDHDKQQGVGVALAP